MKYIHFSLGLYRTKILEKFFPGDIIDYAFLRWLFPSNLSKNAKVLTWGKSKVSYRADYFFSQHKTSQIIRLEDGFLRSFLTADKSPALSIIYDSIGIYYDSFNPSCIELLLVSDQAFTSDLKAVEKAKSLILNARLSKYNYSNDFNFESFKHRFFQRHICERILVVDQTYGDMSVRFGGASDDTFHNMLSSALNENPLATIYVKTHPEVTSGRKKGYLTHIQDSDRIVMIHEDVNPIDLIQKMDKVYVVTSQLGFEALMCGKPVVCFGVPWYAGWGVTDDRVKDSPAWARRTKKRTVDELFAAAYLNYTRYLNPFTHERGTIFEVIEWLILQKKMVANQFKRAV